MRTDERTITVVGAGMFERATVQACCTCTPLHSNNPESIHAHLRLVAVIHPGVFENPVAK